MLYILGEYDSFVWQHPDLRPDGPESTAGFRVQGPILELPGRLASTPFIFGGVYEFNHDWLL
jgi:hypothetical protein